SGLKTLVAEGWRRGLDMVFMPQADPVYCRLGPDNAFWILGVDLDGQQAHALLDCIRGHVAATKREPSRDELLRFYLELMLDSASVATA
ncbi:MAG: hypothetical protein HY021_15880, partial [Burkholderiales bacterium]|nr:hypothetical protein [Burkholderiales bacterium]